MIPPSLHVLAFLVMIGCVPELDKAKDTAETRDSEHSSEPPGDDTGPTTTDSDPGHSTPVDDSDGRDSDAPGDSGTGGDSGEAGDGVVDLSYADCTGDADDGRVVKICGTPALLRVGSPMRAPCDTDGDGAPEVVTTCAYGVCRDEQLTESHFMMEGAFITYTGSVPIGASPACNGDRDADGFQDMVALENDDSYLDSVYIFDGPFPFGSTFDDPVGVFDSAAYRFIGDLAWAPGLGSDGGDAVLVGSQQDYYSLGLSESYYLSEPAGTHTWEDVSARFTSGGEPDVVVGRTMHSEDMDGDGVSEIILGVDDDAWSYGATDPSQAEIIWYSDLVSGEEDVLALTGYDGRIQSGDDDYALLQDEFAIGDIDQDGYPDVVANVELLLEDQIQTTICYTPAFGGCSGYRMDAYIEIDTEYDPYLKKPAVLGDLDGDGREGDLVLVLDQYVFLYASPPSGHVTDAMDATLDFGAQYFTHPSPLGDINADGYGDLALSAPYDDEGGEDVGAIYILFGGAW